jgi:phage protein U
MNFSKSLQAQVSASFDLKAKQSNQPAPEQEKKLKEPIYFEKRWDKTGKKEGIFEVSIGSLDDSGLTVYAQYRPHQLQIDKAATWNSHPNRKPENDLQLGYGGGGARSTSMELFFDAAEIPGGSVEESINKLTELASVRNPGSKDRRMQRPHHCVLVFGHVYQGAFQCVIESLSTKITMFSPDGYPIRATVTVKLKETNSVDMSEEDERQTRAAASLQRSNGAGAGSGGGPERA